jgi:hypothetical protein
LGQYVFSIRAGTPVAHQTAAFLQADLDGTTTVQPTSVLLGQEPSLVSEVERVVQFRVQAGLTEVLSNFVDGGEEKRKAAYPGEVSSTP